LHKQPIHLYPKTDAFYGRYIGQCVKMFIEKHKIKADLVASHGHTIFHQPDAGFTAQIGSGAAIHAETGLPVVNDFRTLDVALGGQGAPLVPIGDALLFKEYDGCLNLGGFSNISYGKNDERIAFDIGPCNLILNRIAALVGKEFDEDGQIASRGATHGELLEQLNTLPFFTTQGAKSLGREWVDEAFWPIIKAYDLPVEDMMATLCEHIAFQIVAAISEAGLTNLFVTGGGALNRHLMERIEQQTTCKVIIPDLKLVQYKEALIFAFLGLLRILGKNNALMSVTGSRADSSGGALFGYL
jgi:anhydro-N-acetylmuramic acid kinase